MLINWTSMQRMYLVLGGNIHRTHKSCMLFLLSLFLEQCFESFNFMMKLVTEIGNHFDASYWSCTMSMSISTHHIGHPQCPCPFRRIILDIHNAYTECNLNRSWPLCHTLCFSYTNDISCRQHFPGVCIHLVIPIYTFTPFIDI